MEALVKHLRASKILNQSPARWLLLFGEVKDLARLKGKIQ
jgi:hypothetical protein